MFARFLKWINSTPVVKRDKTELYLVRKLFEPQYVVPVVGIAIHYKFSPLENPYDPKYLLTKDEVKYVKSGLCRGIDIEVIPVELHHTRQYFYPMYDE